jgi:hypothetical protein
MAGQATPSGLSLCGVLIEALPYLTLADLASDAYERVSYAARRPVGSTPLDGPAPLSPHSPAAYLTAAITNLLTQRAAGLDTSDALDNDALRAVAEAHLALAEAAAATAGGPIESPPPEAPILIPTDFGVSFVASALVRPPWLPAALAISRARTRLTATPLVPPPFAGGDPVAYAAAAGIFWRGVLVQGAAEAAVGEARATALTAALVSAAELNPAPFLLGTPRAPRTTPEWVTAGAAAIAARAADPTGPADVAPIGGSGTADLAARRYAEALRGPTPDGGRNVYVIAGSTVTAVILTLDVMADYELART